jgi:hypothetical protein
MKKSNLLSLLVKGVFIDWCSIVIFGIYSLIGLFNLSTIGLFPNFRNLVFTALLIVAVLVCATFIITFHNEFSWKRLLRWSLILITELGYICNFYFANCSIVLYLIPVYVLGAWSIMSKIYIWKINSQSILRINRG